MRNYQEEFDRRVAFIRDTVAGAHASGIIYGNSGGKDCTLVGILCKAACDNTVGIIMPCSSSATRTTRLSSRKSTASRRASLTSPRSKTSRWRR